MRTHVIGLILVLAGCSNQVDLQPFSSDGCSLFPDQGLITQADWCDCCVIHDVAYWKGGTAEQRHQADTALRECIFAKTEDEALATVMYEGVRVGGSPYFYNGYRWGYGWPFARKYQALSPVELEQVKRRWNEFVTSEDDVGCPVDSLGTLQLSQ